MISRREWLALVGKLGVIGAAASLGLSLPVHAATRPAVALDPLFLNASPRPVISSRTAPRIVQNIMLPTLRNYYVHASTVWAESPSGSTNIVWGYEVDGGQWFTCQTVVGVEERVIAQFTWGTIPGAKYIISFTVDEKTGTHTGTGNYNLIGPATFSGTTLASNLAVGRHAFVVTCTGGSAATLRLGIGAAANNAANATIKISNVQIEMVSANDSRTYPYEYITPGDQRVYNYTHSNTMVGSVVQTPTLGAPYTIARNRSILVIGDSFSDTFDSPILSAGQHGDYPYQARRRFPLGAFAINTRAWPGARISEITTQLTGALAETQGASGAAPYTICVLQGGINDQILYDATLAQMQTDKLAQIAAVEAAGMLPVLVNIAAFDAYASWSSGRQTIVEQFNAWLATLGYPLYDLYADSDDGSGTMKTSWGSSDGLHPSVGWTGGQAIMGRRIADLIQLIGG